MIFLFSENGQRDFHDFYFQKKVLYAFDYDGTLSKIVSDPTKARLETSISQLLVQLAQRTTVAIISGRSVENLRERVPPSIPYLIGNHGIEDLNLVPEVKQRCLDLTKMWDQFFHDNAAAIRHEGADHFHRENKGLSLSLHYRHCANAAKAKRTLLKYVYQLSPLPRIVDGKFVLNLIPQGSPHKGAALLNLMRELQADRAIYVGDDATDEDVFRLRDERILTIRIGKKKKSQAQYYLKTQSEMELLLQRLIEGSVQQVE